MLGAMAHTLSVSAEQDFGSVLPTFMFTTEQVIILSPIYSLQSLGIMLVPKRSPSVARAFFGVYLPLEEHIYKKTGNKPKKNRRKVG